MGIFSSVTEGLVEFYSEIALLVMYQLVKNRELVIAKEERLQRLSTEDIGILKEALDIPLGDLPMKLKFSIRTTEIEQTFEAQRQNLMTRTQLYAMFSEKIIPLFAQMSSPQIPPELKIVLGRITVGTCKMMEDAMKFFGEDETGEYVPSYQKMDAMLDMIREMEQAGMKAGGMQQGGGMNGGQQQQIGQQQQQAAGSGGAIPVENGQLGTGEQAV
jgi:hypothetical protein